MLLSLFQMKHFALFLPRIGLAMFVLVAVAVWNLERVHVYLLPMLPQAMTFFFTFSKQRQACWVIGQETSKKTYCRR